MAVNMGGDPTITARFDGSEAEDGFRKLGDAAGDAAKDVDKASQSAIDTVKELQTAEKEVGEEAEKAGKDSKDAKSKVERAAQDAKSEVQALGDAEKAAGDAAENAGQRGSDAKRKEAEATKAAEKAAREAQKAEADAAAAVELRKMRSAEAAKELSEGLSRAIDTFSSTGDFAASMLDVADGASKAVTAFNPMVGASLMAATNMAKFAKSAWDSSEASQKAAENQARLAKNTQDVARAAAEAAAYRYSATPDEVIEGYQRLKKSIDATTDGLRGLADEKKRNDEEIKQTQLDMNRGATDEIDGKREIERLKKRNEEILKLESELQGQLAAQREAQRVNAQRMDGALDAQRKERAKETADEIKKIEDEATRDYFLRQATSGTQDDVHAAMEATKKYIDELSKKKAQSAEEEKKIQEEIAEGLRYLQDLQSAWIRKGDEDREKRKRDAEEEAKRTKAVQDEVKRINELGQDENLTREEANRLLKESEAALFNGTRNQEEQNELLKKMEVAKQRILALDREAASEAKRAADEQKRAEQDAKQAASDRAAALQARKEQYAQTDDGARMAAAASDPEAVARRYAQQTGRKIGTVRQMMRRGDVGEADLARAARANYDELYEGRFGKGGGEVDEKAMESVAGATRKTGSDLGKLLESNMNALNVVGQSHAGMSDQLNRHEQQIQRFTMQYDANEKNRRSQAAQRFGS